LNALRGTLDSYSRLAGHVGGPAAAPTVNVNVDVNLHVQNAVTQVLAAIDPTPTAPPQQLLALADASDSPNAS
jgi:hypothetical protein